MSEPSGMDFLTATELRGVRGPVHVRVWTCAEEHDEFGAPADMERVQWHYQVSIRSCDGCPALADGGERMGLAACVTAAKVHAATLERQWRAALAATEREGDGE